MEVLSIIKHSLVSDGTNPITGHFRLTRQVAGAGQEMVWRVYDAVRIRDGKVLSPALLCFTPLLCNLNGAFYSSGLRLLMV